MLVLSVGQELRDQEIRLHSPQRQGVQTRVQDLTGLPDGSAVGDLLQWDGTQWILVAGGGAAGEVLTFDGSVWAPAAAPGGQSAWDTIVTDLGDLPAPVAGVITLPSGSYAIKAPVDLGTNILDVPAGNSVLIKGMGLTKVLSTNNAAPMLNVAGEAALETLALANAGGSALQCSGLANLLFCRLDASVGVAVTQTSGRLRDLGSRFTGASNGMSISGGDRTELIETLLQGGTGNALVLTGASVMEVRLGSCDLESSAAPTLLVNAADSDLIVEETDIRCTQANGDCIQVLSAGTLQFIGGKWSTDIASRGNGLHIAGNVQGGLQVVGVHAEDISTSDASGEAFIVWTAGTVRRATVADCNTSTTVSTAINWPAANIPTLGLTIVGNTWDDPSPYVGFTHTTARVNAKANLFQTGLMSETPIVP